MKVAILHEMLVKLGGAEKVVSSFLDFFPDADIFTLIYDEAKVEKDFPKEKISKQVHSLPSQRLYKLTKNQRYCLPFMPRSVEKLDFSGYDLVLVSSSGFAHGAKVGEDTKLIVYSHSPARYMWDWTNEYREDIGYNSGIKGFILGRLFYKLRQWDYYAAQRADLVFANSNNTKSRVKKYHRRKAKVLYPPVETTRFAKELDFTDILLEKMGLTGDHYYVIISALTEFKKIDVAVRAFNSMPHLKLIVIGLGDHQETLQKEAKENTIFAGAKYGDELVALVQNSLGLVFPGEEDFGIVPIEAMSAGKPVFALRKGGLTETILESETGAFFDDPQGADFVENFLLFHNQNTTGWFKSRECKAQAENFSVEKFHKKLSKNIDKLLSLVKMQ